MATKAELEKLNDDLQAESVDLIKKINKLESDAYMASVNLKIEKDRVSDLVNANNQLRGNITDIQHSLRTINDVWWPTKDLNPNGFILSDDNPLPEDEAEVFNFLRHLYVLTVR